MTIKQPAVLFTVTHLIGARPFASSASAKFGATSENTRLHINTILFLSLISHSISRFYSFNLISCCELEVFIPLFLITAARYCYCPGRLEEVQASARKSRTL